MSAIGNQVKLARLQGDMPKLLELRREIKARTPKFQRQESWRYTRIHDPWRKPKGVDSHMRLSVKGWPALVKIGYRVPRKVRGLHPSGYRDILVHNLKELESLTPNLDAARLAAGVGRKKKVELAKRAKELGIRVLNGRGLLFGLEEPKDVGTESKKEKPSEEKVEIPKQSLKKSRKKTSKPKKESKKIKKKK